MDEAGHQSSFSSAQTVPLTDDHTYRRYGAYLFVHGLVDHFNYHSYHLTFHVAEVRTCQIS